MSTLEASELAIEAGGRAVVQGLTLSFAPPDVRFETLRVQA